MGKRVTLRIHLMEGVLKYAKRTKLYQADTKLSIEVSKNVGKWLLSISDGGFREYCIVTQCQRHFEYQRQ
jgi:hypothetical protein